MKYTLILFTAGLLFINHYDKIQQAIFPPQHCVAEGQMNLKAPRINTSPEELNEQFTPIADLYDLSEAVVVHIIIDAKGEIQNPTLLNVNNPRASQKILNLIKSAGITPGTVSGKPTSNSLSLTLTANH